MSQGGSAMLCRHVWIANSGRGGQPDFRTNRQMASVPIMHVECRTCGTRTWFTDQQWAALDEVPPGTPMPNPLEKP